jgi:hypothetical protein
MGLDMYLYVAQDLKSEFNHADINAWQTCNEIASKFMIPNPEKIYRAFFDGLVPEIMEYYNAEKREPGSGKLPATKLDLNSLFSGDGNLQVRMVYDVYNFDTYSEFKQHFMQEAEICLKYSQKYVANSNEIRKLLAPWGGDLPITEYISWRKAPAIHSYFKSRITERPKYYFHAISKEDITDLKQRIEQVLNQPKNETLITELFPILDPIPFGGSDEYDDYFFEVLKETLSKITTMEETVFTATNSDELVFYYGYSG